MYLYVKHSTTVQHQYVQVSLLVQAMNPVRYYVSKASARIHFYTIPTDHGRLYRARYLGNRRHPIGRITLYFYIVNTVM